MATLYGEDLAAIHDAGFDAWARAAANVLLAHAPPGLVVDLGCGSGPLAEEVAAAGRPVLGIDRSAAMLRLAKARVPQPSAEFRQADLLEAELPRCAAIAIVGEGLNYRSEGNHLAKVKALLKRAHAALQPNGILLLDVAGPGRARGGTKTWGEGAGWAVLSEAEERGEDLVRRIVTFRQVAGEWRRAEETHTLRLLPLNQLERDLAKAGFAVQRRTAYGTVELPKGHAVFIARKPAA